MAVIKINADNSVSLVNLAPGVNEQTEAAKIGGIVYSGELYEYNLWDTQLRIVIEGRTAQQLSDFIVSECNRLLEQYAGPVLSGYNSLEVQSWPFQAAAAKAYTDTGGVEISPVLQKLYVQRGGTIADLVTRITEAETAFNDQFWPALSRYKAVIDMDLQSPTAEGKQSVIDNHLYVDWEEV